MHRLIVLALLLTTSLALTAAPTPAQAAEPASVSAEESHDYTQDVYWAEKRRIRSIQKKEFLKDSRHAFSLTFGTIPNDEFFFYFPVGLRYSYLFTEDIAMEVWGNYIAAAKTGLEGYLTENFNGTLIVEVPEQLMVMGGVNGVWSPFQGKFSIFDSLLQFDFFATVGAGFILTEVQDLGRKKLRPNMSGNVGLGFQLYLTDFLSMRFDYRQFFYPAAQICDEGGGCKGGGLAHPMEFTLGVNLWTSAPE
jgi:outer membrane beta-barrel protein